MKSIKPGRGPSGMSFMGSVIVIIFGIFWIIIAFSMCSNSSFGIIGSIFPLFGILFLIFGVIQAIYTYKNVTGKNRFSAFDITDSSEEGDPSDKWIKNNIHDKINNDKTKETHEEIQYCPYCGISLNEDYSFCPKCGKSVK